MTQPTVTPDTASRSVDGGPTPDERGILSALQRDAARLRALNRIAQAASLIALGALLAWFALLLALPWHAPARSATRWWFWVVAPASLCVVGGAHLLRRRPSSLLSAPECKDKRAIGALLLAFDGAQGEVRARCGDALLALLPRLGSGDHVLLDSAQRQAMREILARSLCVDQNLCIEIINAMRVVADDDALRMVEGLASMPPVGRTHARVRDYARSALPDIRARAEAVARAETLLRPADAPDDGMLLRPAAGVSPGDDDRLVRPALAQGTDAGPADRQS